MKLRRLLSTGAVAAFAVAGVAAQSGTAFAASDATPLRALGAPIGLQVGTAVIPDDLNNPAYAKIAGQQFSVVTPGNEMKWETVEPTQGKYDWSGGDRLVSFAQAHGQLVRGHTLLWHSQLPGWLTAGVANNTISKTQLKALLQKHITDEVTHFKGKIWQWDVANEFMANSWDPNPLSDGVNGDDFWVKNLKAQGVPIDGVGEQGHLDTQYGFNATKFQLDLQKFADLGLKVAVTEADVRTFVDSPTTQVPTVPNMVAVQQADWKGLVDGCLAIKQCISFTAWGFGDADSWVPYTFAKEGAAGLYDVNLNAKATYIALHDELAHAKGTAPKR